MFCLFVWNAVISRSDGFVYECYMYNKRLFIMNFNLQGEKKQGECNILSDIYFSL